MEKWKEWTVIKKRCSCQSKKGYNQRWEWHFLHLKRDTQERWRKALVRMEMGNLHVEGKGHLSVFNRGIYQIWKGWGPHIKMRHLTEGNMVLIKKEKGYLREREEGSYYEEKSALIKKKKRGRVKAKKKGQKYQRWKGEFLAPEKRYSSEMKRVGKGNLSYVKRGNLGYLKNWGTVPPPPPPPTTFS